MKDSAYEVTLKGEQALKAAGKLLPAVNEDGAKAADVQNAVQLDPAIFQASGGVDDFSHRIHDGTEISLLRFLRDAGKHCPSHPLEALRQEQIVVHLSLRLVPKNHTTFQSFRTQFSR